MKKLLQSIKTKIKTIWNKLFSKSKILVHMSVHAVEALKTFNESGAANLLDYAVTTAIPGSADDAAVKIGRDFIRNKFPEILVQLKIIESTMDLEDSNIEKLRKMLEALQLNPMCGVLYKGTAGKFMELISDGEFDFNDSCDLTYFYFKEMQALKNGTN